MKSAAVLARDLDSALSRLGASLTLQPKPAAETVPTGIAEIDCLTGGLPRGAITEIFGPASSGRTSVLISALAQATARQEVCALVDACDSFDPASGAAAGIDLDCLLWVRCGGNPEHALKAADLLINAGGIGVIALDIAEVPARIGRRIPIPSWFRLRRAIEHTPTVLIVIEPDPYAKSSASLLLEMKREGTGWSGAVNARLLRGASVAAVPRKPVRPAAACFEVRAVNRR